MSIVFRCPSCGEPLPETLVCGACGAAVERREGIALFSCADDAQKADQAAFFDEATDAEFEIERPNGLPRFYGWLLRRKFQRAVEGVPLRGSTVLVVCGGSGLDAEFLAAGGATVVTSDVSLGAAQRAAERARRHGVAFESIVADAEHLPFADRAFDVVYVHDGLHHLDDPLAGLVEMARVVRSWVCVTEPAVAAATSAAVRVGLALETEDAGNRVGRLTTAEVSELLEAQGLAVARAYRYAMLYRHEPGLPVRTLSLPGIFALGRTGMKVLDMLIGRFGNKLVVIGRRPDGES